MDLAEDPSSQPVFIKAGFKWLYIVAMFLFLTGGINTSHKQASWGIVGKVAGCVGRTDPPTWGQLSTSLKECSPLARFLEKLMGQMSLLSACHRNNRANGRVWR